MNWFKRFICAHEVDMEKLDVPVCKKCEVEIPRVLTTNSGWKANPKLEKWSIKKSLPKIREVFKSFRK